MTDVPEGLGVMTPEHVLWALFVELLERACQFHPTPEPEEGFAFQSGVYGDLGVAWRCPGERNRPRATAILRMMGATDEQVLAALDYFDEHGGYCDCEIVFNVENLAGHDEGDDDPPREAE